MDEGDVVEILRAGFHTVLVVAGPALAAASPYLSAGGAAYLPPSSSAVDPPPPSPPAAPATQYIYPRGQPAGGVSNGSAAVAHPRPPGLRQSTGRRR